MFGLPYREVWALDFEFISKSGALPVPVCMVARELGSNRLVRLWQDKLGVRPPFDVDAEVLFVSYYAPAEWGCFLALGWPLPQRILDLYAEFRNETNGIALPEGRGLLSALSHHGIASITKAEKNIERDLVLRGGPWTAAERTQILNYCQSDVDCLVPLLERILPAIRSRPNGLGQALLRGRYTTAVARIEATGVPIDVDLLGLIRSRWDAIKLDLVRAVDKDYGVYEGTTFKAGLFAAWLAAERIDWPRTATGQLQLDGDTFRDISKRYLKLEPLKELRNSLSELRLESLAVGPDGRNRVMLSPFGARSGRNTPSNAKFVFGPAVWVRGLIRPDRGRALAYVDWSSQEVWIAAKLSGDRALLGAVMSGDPYLAFAKMAGLAPMNATKKSHKEIRDVCKTVVLGTNYGMGPDSLAYRTGLSKIEAVELLRRLAITFPTFTDWAQHVIDVGQLTGQLATVFGWRIHVTGTSRPTSLRNYPMQSNGAEMLRIACCLATERGIEVCAPVHDALLIEAPAGEITDAVTVTRTAVEIVQWPGRYADPRGAVMWARVTELL
jgi:DNA polymerase-1